MYTDRVIEHFRNPHNMGKLDDYSAIGKVGNMVCGDVMWLYIKVEQDDKGFDVIADISWETFGCTAAIATSSMVSDLAKARKIAMERHWPARVDEVVAARIPDTPGSLSRLLAPLSEQRIDVEYMYAFTGFSSSEAVMIFGFKDPAKATEVLKANGVVLLGAREFGALESEGD